MSCQQVEAWLMRADTDQLQPEGEVAAHLAGCQDCSASVTRVQVGTRAAADWLNSWSSNLEPHDLVEQIQQDQAMARSRMDHWWGVAGTVAIVALSLLVYVAKAERMMAVRARLGFPDPPYITSMFVRCISPEVAAEIAYSILNPSKGMVKYNREDRSIVLAGSRDMVREAELAIRTMDGTIDLAHPKPCSLTTPLRQPAAADPAS